MTGIKQKVKLIGGDGSTFVLQIAEIMISGVLRNVVEHCSCRESMLEVPLPNIQGSVLKKVVDFLVYYEIDLMNDINRSPLVVPSLSLVVQEWYARYIEVDHAMLFDLLFAADYMDIQPLFDLACVAIAIQVDGLSPNELRQKFDIIESISDYTGWQRYENYLARLSHSILASIAELIASIYGLYSLGVCVGCFESSELENLTIKATAARHRELGIACCIEQQLVGRLFSGLYWCLSEWDVDFLHELIAFINLDEKKNIILTGPNLLFGSIFEKPSLNSIGDLAFLKGSFDIYVTRSVVDLVVRTLIFHSFRETVIGVSVCTEAFHHIRRFHRFREKEQQSLFIVLHCIDEDGDMGIDIEQLPDWNSNSLCGCGYEMSILNVLAWDGASFSIKSPGFTFARQVAIPWHIQSAFNKLIKVPHGLKMISFEQLGELLDFQLLRRIRSIVQFNISVDSKEGALQNALFNASWTLLILKQYCQRASILAGFGFTVAGLNQPLYLIDLNLCLRQIELASSHLGTRYKAILAPTAVDVAYRVDRAAFVLTECIKEYAIPRMGGIHAVKHFFSRLYFESEAIPIWCNGSKDLWFVYLGYLILRYCQYMKLNHKQKKLYGYQAAGRSRKRFRRYELRRQWYQKYKIWLQKLSHSREEVTWTDCHKAIELRVMSWVFGHYTVDDVPYDCYFPLQTRNRMGLQCNHVWYLSSMDWYKKKWLRDYINLPVVCRQMMSVYIDWDWVGQQNYLQYQSKYKYVGIVDKD